jgi:hypothetical protein
MTQDYYLGRRSVDTQAAIALEAALRDALVEGESRGKTWAKKKARSGDGS